MALTLEVTSRAQRDQMGDSAVRQFGREGGTIGRAEDNDWRLPDTERYISSHHATIDFQSGSYYLIDTSTNGIYVNGSDMPISRSKPQRLFDGDVLRMGDYMISVAIDEGFELLTEDEDHRSSIARADFVQIDEDSDDLSLIDPDEMTGARELDARLLDNTVVRSKHWTKERPPESASEQKPKVTAIHHGGPQRTGDEPQRRRQSADAPRHGTRLPADPVEAFLHGLGIGEDALPKPYDRRALYNAGVALREFVLGTMDLMNNRTAVQNSYGLARDGAPADANPVEQASDYEEVVSLLLTGGRSGYGANVHNVREAVQGLKHHQIAIVCAMRDAVHAFSDQLAPDMLAEKFDGALKRTALFGGSNKARYWDLYAELYQTLVRDQSTRLPDGFTEDFARSYDEHLQRLRRDAEHRRESAGRASQAGN